MQSTNEELETSREEMQSLNEELQTVNAELQSKILALTQANDDLENLLNSTQIPTLFLDRQCRVRRFTPDIDKVVHLIQSDAGRSISDITTKLDYSDLMRDAAQVLETLVPKEIEVHARNGACYSLRIAPYRTASNAIDGVVAAFVDVMQIKLAERGLDEARDYAKSVVDTMRESLVILDPSLRVVSANPAFYRTFCLQPREVANQPIWEIGDRRWDLPQLRRSLERVISEGEKMVDFEVDFPGEKDTQIVMNARRLERSDGADRAVLLVMEDVSERRDLERRLRALAYSAALVEARERRRLADDLHDSLGQLLAVARLKLGLLRSEPAPLDLEARVREIEQLIGEADEQAASMVVELSPPVPEEGSIEAGVRWVADDVSRRFGLEIKVDEDAEPKPLDEGVRITLYRSVRELLVNVAKHAGTRQARVRISRQGPLVHVWVADRGAGFDPRETSRGFGLFSVRERLLHIGGSLEIQSEPGDGTQAHLTVPVSEPQSAGTKTP